MNSLYNNSIDRFEKLINDISNSTAEEYDIENLNPDYYISLPKLFGNIKFKVNNIDDVETKSSFTKKQKEFNNKFIDEMIEKLKLFKDESFILKEINLSDDINGKIKSVDKYIMKDFYTRVKEFIDTNNLVPDNNRELKEKLLKDRSILISLKDIINENKSIITVDTPINKDLNKILKSIENINKGTPKKNIGNILKAIKGLNEKLETDTIMTEEVELNLIDLGKLMSILRLGKSSLPTYDNKIEILQKYKFKFIDI